MFLSRFLYGGAASRNASIGYLLYLSLKRILGLVIRPGRIHVSARVLIKLVSRVLIISRPSRFLLSYCAHVNVVQNGGGFLSVGLCGCLAVSFSSVVGIVFWFDCFGCLDPHLGVLTSISGLLWACSSISTRLTLMQPRHDCCTLLLAAR